MILSGARLVASEADALLEHFGDIGSALRASAPELRALGLGDYSVASILKPRADEIDQALSWASESNHHLVPYDAPDYPELLGRIPDAPVLLYINGDPGLLHLPALAIVGSRNPTSGGEQNAHNFARHLGGSGFCILSGMAQGIDAAAHRGALDGGGKTVAFLGHGIDRVYPAINRDLAHRIATSGALVTEYPPGTPPRKEHFPARNRLISGCSLGVLVVEAARRSGSLISARLASEQGREVFAIPGSIHNALSRGCHQLIRQGAKLVESADDIVSELAPLTSHLQNVVATADANRNADSELMQNDFRDESSAKIRPDRDEDYKLLIKTIGHDPKTPDEIAEKSGLTIDQVSSMLLILELEGEVQALNGGQYAILKETLLA